MTIKLTHNGHEVGYDENTDEWYCRELEMKGRTLSGLKQKINDVDNAERRINGKNGLKFLHLPSYGYRSGDEAEVTASMFDANGSALWVKDGANSRKKVGVHELFEDTAEHRALLKEARELRKQASELTAKADAVIKSIKRLMIDRLKALNLETKPK